MPQLPRLAVALAATAVLLPAAPASAGIDAGASYLEGRTAGSGCVAEPGRAPSASLTGWAAIGLAAAGADASAQADCIARSAGGLRVATDVELAILGLVAAGADPTDASGTNLVARLRAAIHANGQIGPTGNSHIFGVLALRAARSRVPAKSVRRLRALQRADGSYAWTGGVASDSNMTAAAIQALRATGHATTSRPVKRALSALARFRSGGGYGQLRRDAPDAQSTAWAVQALVAAGRPSKAARAWLLARQRRDGSFEYQKGRVVTPAWVTAEVLPALARRPLPVR